MDKITTDRVKLIRSIQSALNTDFSKAEKIVIRKIIKDIRKNKNLHFLSISQEKNGKVSYAQKPDFKFDNEKRTRTTLRRYIRRQLQIPSDKFSDKALFELGRAVAGETVSHDKLDKRIEILEGDDIEGHYRTTCTDSCMTGEDNAWKVRLYSENPDKVKLVVLDDIVRALLWTSDDGTIILDRIYPSGCDAVGLLQTWAKNNGYVYRSSTGAGDGNLSDGKNYQISLNHSGTYPYLDTFAYAEDHGNGKMTISNKTWFGEIELTNTDGGHSQLYHCSCCNNTVSEDDRYTAFDETYCQDCFYDSFFFCSHCGYEACNDDRVTVSDEDYCPECVKKLFVICDDCDEYFKEEKLVKINLLDGSVAMVCEECLDEYSLCAGCLEYFEYRDMSEITNNFLTHSGQ